MMVQDAHIGSKRRYSVAAAIVCNAINAVGLSIGLPLLSVTLEQRGASGLMIGLIAAMSGIATLIVSPFAGLLVHRFGVVVSLIGSITLSAVSFFAFYFAEPLWLWFVLRFINGSALALTLVASEFWINALVHAQRRGLVTGLYTAVQSIGFVIGPVLLALMGSRGLLPFGVGAGLMLLAVFPALLGANAAPITHTSPRRSTVIAFLLATPIATLAAFAFGAIEGGMNLLPVYGMHLGEDETIAILLAAIVALGNLFLQIPIGLLSDKVDRRKVLMACAAIAVMGALLMPISAHDAWRFFAVLFVWGGVVAALYSVGLALLEGSCSGSKLASANAAFVMHYSAGRLAGPPLVGVSIDVWNPHGFAVMMALFPAIYLAVAALNWILTGPTHRSS
ncbi:MAG TPA: MFS transporter [Methyloceanibacter sp.]|jgi:MFS family permease|nr:MFS transporter [Methyloceanibacter sp.]